MPFTVASAAPDRIVMLDLRGLKCPLPVLRTRKALRRLPEGATLVVLCTDPLAGLDIPHFLRAEGHRLLGCTEADGVSRFHMEKVEAGGRSASDQDAAASRSVVK